MQLHRHRSRQCITSKNWQPQQHHYSNEFSSQAKHVRSLILFDCTCQLSKTEIRDILRIPVNLALLISNVQIPKERYARGEINRDEYV